MNPQIGRLPLVPTIAPLLLEICRSVDFEDGTRIQGW